MREVQVLGGGPGVRGQSRRIRVGVEEVEDSGKKKNSELQDSDWEEEDWKERIWTENKEDEEGRGLISHLVGVEGFVFMNADTEMSVSPT